MCTSRALGLFGPVSHGLIVVLLILFPVVAVSAQDQKTVLTVYGSRSDQLSNIVVEREIRATRSREPGTNLEHYTANVASGTVIHLRESTFWEQYKWPVVTVAVLVIQLLLIVGLLLEPRQRWLANQRLTESEGRFSKAFRSNPQPMSLTTLEEGKYVDVNEAFLSMSGYTRAEVIDHTSLELRIFNSPEERNSFLVHPLLTKGAVRNSEMNFRTKSGAFRVLLSSAELLDVAGQKCILVASSDITDRIRSERELTQLTVRLFNLQDEERRRIARELHDGTAQNLFVISLNLAKLSQPSLLDQAQIDELVSESQALVNQSLQEIRTLSYLLHPPLLDQAGLVAALQWYAEGFSKRSGVYVEVFAQAIGRLPSEIEMALFRVVQEALTNIRRHSGSEVAQIRLERQIGNVILEISDQGRGLEPSDSSSESISMGVGISGMRQRLRQLGGTLEISSNDRGTLIAAMVPLTNGVHHEKNSFGGRS
jgi:PAS domain S-box-containing protein